MGQYKGKECIVTRKKARPDYVIVNIIDGPTIEIHKSFVK